MDCWNKSAVGMCNKNHANAEIYGKRLSWLPKKMNSVNLWLSFSPSYDLTAG